MLTAVLRTVSLLSVVLLGTLLAAPSARGQWVQTNGPYGGGVSCLVQNKDTLYAGTDGGVFCSTDNGESWKNLNSPPKVNTILVNDSKIFASCGDSVFVTSNSGSTWLEINNGLPANWEPASILGSDTNLFVCMAGEGIYRSIDGGSNWLPISNGIPAIFLDYLSLSEGKLYAGNASAGTFVSSDWGNSWSQLDGGLGNTTIHNIITIGTKLFASSLGGLFVSNDSGSHWQKSGSFLDVYALCTNASLVYVSTPYGIYFSTDTGQSWQRGDPNIAFNDLAISGNYVLAGGDGVSRSSDSGVTWEPSNSGLIATGFNAIASNQNTLFAGGNGVYSSTDDGDSWWPEDSGLTQGYQLVHCFLSDSDRIFMGTERVYSSTNKGLSWQIDSVGFPLCDVFGLARSENTLWACTDHQGIVYYSTDNGQTWVSDSSGLPFPSANGVAVTGLGNNILVGIKDAYGGLYSSTNFRPWVPIQGIQKIVHGVNCFLHSGTNLFAGLDVNEILTSSDSGLSWTNISSGLPYDAYSFGGGVSSLLIVNSKIFAGSEYGVFLSTNDGSSWANISSGLTNPKIQGLTLQNGFLFAATAGSGVWRRPLSDFGISSVSQKQPESTAAISVFPNPLSQSAQIEYTAAASGFADVRIVNQLGAEVARIFSGELSAGDHSFAWSNTTGLPAEMYECVVRMNGQTHTIPLVLSR